VAQVSFHSERWREGQDSGASGRARFGLAIIRLPESPESPELPRLKILNFFHRTLTRKMPISGFGFGFGFGFDFQLPTYQFNYPISNTHLPIYPITNPKSVSRKIQNSGNSGDYGNFLTWLPCA
jgi:hypothetical protein